MRKLLVGLIAGGLLMAGPAGATFPGRNGLIAGEGPGSGLWLVGASVKFVGLGFHPAWSPDGRRLLIGEPRSIEIATVEGMRLTGRWVVVRQAGRVRWVGSPSWSGDGRHVVYVQGEPYGGSDIYKVRVADGRRFRLTHAPRGWRNLDPAWSPDGSTIAYSACNPSGSRCALALMDAGGSNPRVVLSRRPGVEVIRPKWSPDGRKLGLTLVDVDNHFITQSVILDLASHKLRAAVDEAFDAWSPDGHRILVRVLRDLSGGCSDGLAVMTEAGKLVRYLPCGLDFADWQPLH